ncbi:OLC1v1000132C1 [Oldenlandia corymbosa var. corymbosa]|uniref:OLC1v1000132C1 n=1 Tax=Oldenlandia corymbosa var. corymbosa TaxID=529605 RepID=A0AAV1D349_OLDCO|nr:OLC1v1000132C1 [Oldenlandia corymbosa var. corymbosa]
MASQLILPNFSLFILAILFLGALQGSRGDFRYVEIENKATPALGGDRYIHDIGDEYTAMKVFNATDFAWEIFQENSTATRKSFTHIKVVIQDNLWGAFTEKNEIHIGALYIQNFTGDVKFEITGIIYHEVSLVWQWYGNGEAPEGLIDGIADYVRLKSGYVPYYFVKPGQGDKWDEGQSVTAYFLDYCDNLKENGSFIAELNGKMRYGYSDAYFVELLGKTVDELWSDYKAQYN